MIIKKCKGPVRLKKEREDGNRKTFFLGFYKIQLSRQRRHTGNNSSAASEVRNNTTRPQWERRVVLGTGGEEVPARRGAGAARTGFQPDASHGDRGREVTAVRVRARGCTGLRGGRQTGGPGAGAWARRGPGTCRPWTEGGRGDAAGLPMGDG